MSFRSADVSSFNRSSRVLSDALEAVPASIDLPMVNTELLVHQRAAELAAIDFSNTSPPGASDSSDSEEPLLAYAPPQPRPTETSHLLSGQQDLESFNALLGQPQTSDDYFEFNDSNLASKASSILNFTRKLNRSVLNKLLNISQRQDSVLRPRLAFTPVIDLFYESTALMPCVFLGLLLNVLDALSYGMIIFPINKPVFSDLGPAGLLMFYILCVVSQLVYLLGGLAFPLAVGSEMIEVTPFFHLMAASITARIGAENKDAVVATTITCYCISAFVTGLAFLLLGRFKLGQLIGFFPRHILIGSIGGVGYFLIVTGLEVTLRLTTPFGYDRETWAFLLSGPALIKWTLSLLITVVLVVMQRTSKRLASFSLLLPVYFIVVFAFIHFLIWIVPGWDLQSARDNGYIFDVKAAAAALQPTTQLSSEAWYHFYTLYKFKLVQWKHIAAQFPLMMALTFFGMLHVPINVPALAILTNTDNVDLDRELTAHGILNILLGLVGLIQNYLVYSNSLLFIRSGAGDKRLAGLLLAGTTAIIMFIGPVLIKFIPVCVVGALIFLLGYELMKESLYDLYGRLSNFDYMTIVVIIITMGLVDFVYGIVLGILIAFILFVVENAHHNPVKRVFTGEMVRSTIKRNTLTNNFLRNVGSQTLVIKLQGNIFFGLIGSVEKEIRRRFANIRSEHSFRYLILDFGLVFTVDYTAAEGLQSIQSFTRKNNAFLILSSVPSDAILQALINVGLVDSLASSDGAATQVFHDLNSALEWSENEYLMSVYAMKQQRRARAARGSISHGYGAIAKSRAADIPHSSIQDEFKYNITELYLNPMSLMNNPHGFGLPGQRNILRAITKLVDEESVYMNQPDVGTSALTAGLSLGKSSPPGPSSPSDPDSTPSDLNDQEYQLLQLVRKTFQGISLKPITFWKPMLAFLRPVQILKGHSYYPYGRQSHGASPVDERVSNLLDDDTSDHGGFFFILESGLIQLSYDFNQGQISETLVPRTAFGSLGIRPQFGSRPNSSASSASTIRNGVTGGMQISMVNRYNHLKIEALKDLRIWKLNAEGFHKMAENPQMKDIVVELLAIEVNLLSERFDKITNFILLSS